MRVATTVLTEFISANPNHLLDQSALVAWTAAAHLHSDELQGRRTESLPAFFKRFAVKPAQICQRGFDVADPTHARWAEMVIYGGTDSPHGQDIGIRTRYFLERSLEVFHELYFQATAPSHLIHVTCTGYVSPSAAQRLVSQKGWDRATDVTHAYHMGCYAAMPAVRMAQAFSLVPPHESRDSRVDVVHTEICSLHMNPADHTPEQIVVQSLFADGHIRYSLVPEGSARSGFRILRICEQIVPDSTQDMSWTPSKWGMKMTLSREVPEKIRSALRPFLERLVEGTEHSLKWLLSHAIFAVHPGGPKIVQAVEELLGLQEHQTASSRKVLHQRGNMSSATLPHIWKELSEQRLPSGTFIVSMAFGPGLTIFGSLFEVL